MMPAIGSEWTARDGRKMTVLRIVDPGIGQKHHRVVLSVQNPGYRVRGFTEISTASFGLAPNSFLKPSDEYLRKLVDGKSTS